jgi:cytochrome b involved in lipid metabolism
VFDVTSYLDDHPGGAESILLNAGARAPQAAMVH